MGVAAAREDIIGGPTGRLSASDLVDVETDARASKVLVALANLVPELGVGNIATRVIVEDLSR